MNWTELSYSYWITHYDEIIRNYYEHLKLVQMISKQHFKIMSLLPNATLTTYVSIYVAHIMAKYDLKSTWERLSQHQERLFSLSLCFRVSVAEYYNETGAVHMMSSKGRLWYVKLYQSPWHNSINLKAYLSVRHNWYWQLHDFMQARYKPWGWEGINTTLIAFGSWLSPPLLMICLGRNSYQDNAS